MLARLIAKTVVVHTVTYFAVGLLAYWVGGYAATFSRPPLSYFLRPTSSPWVVAGPLFQPIRGLLFALAFYPLRAVLFARPRGWLITWWLLVALGILSSFGPTPGSVEGLVYTVVPPLAQLLGLWEVLLQSFLLATLLFYWVNHAEKKWLGVTLTALFCVVLILPVLGLLTAS